MVSFFLFISLFFIITFFFLIFFFFFFLPFVIYFFIFNLPDFQAIHQDKALRDLVSFYILQTPSQE